MDGTKVEGRIDWLTATYVEGEQARLALKRADDLLSVSEVAGFTIHPWEFFGYHGHAVTGIAWGVRGDGMIVRLSGEQAGHYWRGFAENASNVSRIDLAVTVQHPTDDPSLARRAYATVARQEKVRPGKLQYSLITSTKGGDTLYCGKRVSDLFGRIYDKMRESGESVYRNCWRYELEVKHDPALGVARRLLGAAHEQEAIIQTVHDYFVKRNVNPSFMASGGEVVDLSYERPTDIERQMAWIRSAIRPVVWRLREAGYETDVLAALGIRTDGRPDGQP